MLRKIVALLALFAALFPGCAFADTSDEPLVIGAKAAILMEAETGRVLLEKNADQRLPMASTTKIMTCLLALENSSLEETVTVGKNAAGVTGTSLYLSQGETLTMEQMLYGLMLRSGNDAAVAIAEHVDGSVEEFVARMNRRAVELGADAQFKNPHGLDQQGHEASARAMALILRECLKNETFARISSTKEKVIPWPGNEYSRVLKNKNRLLTSYEGATGGKTGYTSGAGRCLVFSAERNGMRLVGCVLNCPTWFDTAQAMLDYGFEHYSMQEVSRAGDSMGQVAVTGGQKRSAPVQTAEGLRVPVGMGEKIVVQTQLPDDAPAPVRRGDAAGVYQVRSGGQLLAQGKLVYGESVSKNNMEGALERVVGHWSLLR